MITQRQGTTPLNADRIVDNCPIAWSHLLYYFSPPRHSQLVQSPNPETMTSTGNNSADCVVCVVQKRVAVTATVAKSTTSNYPSCRLTHGARLGTRVVRSNKLHFEELPGRAGNGGGSDLFVARGGRVSDYDKNVQSLERGCRAQRQDEIKPRQRRVTCRDVIHPCRQEDQTQEHDGRKVFSGG